MGSYSPRIPRTGNANLKLDPLPGSDSTQIRPPCRSTIFWQIASPLLRQAAQSGQPVLVFGEMVSLLWDAALVNAAIEVEVMWNELGGQYPFSLLCAYPARPVTCSHYLDALTEVCRTHTEVTGSPPDPELADLPD